MQGDLCMLTERAHPVIVETTWQRTAIIRTSAEVERAVHERVVHWNRAVSKASCGGRSKLQQRRADANRDILDDMVPQIALRLDAKPQTGVPRQGDEHVIEERHGSLDRGFASLRDLYPN